MFEYIAKLLNAVQDDMKGTMTMPIAEHLFTVNRQAMPLGKELVEIFHHHVAQLLFQGVNTVKNNCGPTVAALFHIQKFMSLQAINRK